MAQKAFYCTAIGRENLPILAHFYLFAVMPKYGQFPLAIRVFHPPSAINNQISGRMSHILYKTSVSPTKQL
jgi:hypothetical protein